MHMSDALLSAPVAVGADIIALSLLAISAKKIKNEENEISIPLMGVTGAFVFAAQMVNFSIPGTGSSGHIIGGILLASLLGPWAAFLTLASVIIIQCLVFADGGLLALGCNILNMDAMTTLIAYPLIFRPLLKFPAPAWKIFVVSILASVVGLEAGALSVSLETLLSGITYIPAGKFLLLMTSIHLPIGIGEGVATAAILYFIQKSRPALLTYENKNDINKSKMRSSLAWFGVAAIVVGGLIALLASTNPDGLEWSIFNVTGLEGLTSNNAGTIGTSASAIQHSTAFMPDYDHNLAGIAGSTMVLFLVWAITSIVTSARKLKAKKHYVEK